MVELLPPCQQTPEIEEIWKIYLIFSYTDFTNFEKSLKNSEKLVFLFSFHQLIDEGNFKYLKLFQESSQIEPIKNQERKIAIYFSQEF